MPIDQQDDYADNMLAQQISQVPGVAQALIFGEQKPAVRVQINPAAAANLGLSLEDVRNVLTQASIDNPKGSFDGPNQSSTIESNDQLLKAEAFQKVVVAYRNGAPVHISDIGTAIDGVENAKIAGWAGVHRGVAIGVFRQPGANIIETTDLVKAELPRIRATIPPSINVEVMQDRTIMIRASVDDVEKTLLITIGLVVMVIFLFLRKLWATVIPGIAVPLSLVGTFGVMYLLGYSIDNLSLMALDDRGGIRRRRRHRHDREHRPIYRTGESPYRAAVKGAGISASRSSPSHSL